MQVLHPDSDGLMAYMYTKMAYCEYTVRPNKKETRIISEISSLPRKI